MANVVPAGQPAPAGKEAGPVCANLALSEPVLEETNCLLAVSKAVYSPRPPAIRKHSYKKLGEYRAREAFELNTGEKFQIDYMGCESQMVDIRMESVALAKAKTSLGNVYAATVQALSLLDKVKPATS